MLHKNGAMERDRNEAYPARVRGCTKVAAKKTSGCDHGGVVLGLGSMARTYGASHRRCDPCVLLCL